MKNRTIYNKVRQYALANMSDDEFEAKTIGEILQAAGTEGRVSNTFASNMKRAILEEITARDDDNRIKVLKAGVKAFCDTNFPAWEAEKGTEEGKPFVKIWPRGKP